MGSSPTVALHKGVVKGVGNLELSDQFHMDSWWPKNSVLTAIVRRLDDK